MKPKFLLFAFFFICLKNSSAQPTIQWQKCLGGSLAEYPYNIQETSDSGYIVAGDSYSNDGDVSGNHGGADVWIIKLSSSGNIQWQKLLGGTLNEVATSIQQVYDGGYILAGVSRSNDGDVSGHHGTSSYDDYWIVKLSDSGTIQWQKSLGGSLDDAALSIAETSDSGYIVAGYSVSNDGDVSGNHGAFDYWIVKLTCAGVIEWQKSLGGSLYDIAHTIQQTSDDGYIISGHSYSNDGEVTGHHGTSTFFDYWIVKIGSSGAIEWEKSLGGTDDDINPSINKTLDGCYIVAGGSYSNDGDVSGNHGNTDIWIVKLDSSGTINWQKSIGGTLIEAPNSIQNTNDNGFILAGVSTSNDGDVSGNHGNSDYWIVKLDSAGAIQWQKCLGGTDNETSCFIQQTSDGGYILDGYCRSNDGDVSGNHGNVDYWIVKLNPFTDIEEQINPTQFTIYPNPSSTTFTFKINKNIPNPELVICDLLGKEIMRKQITDGGIEIDMENMGSGVYFARVTDNKKDYVRKLIVE